MSIADVTLLDVLEHELDAELGIDPECVAVGCGGCRLERAEYPCDCPLCRTGYSRTYHDGETTWWQCGRCGHLFDLDDLVLLADGDRDLCEPCTNARLDGAATRTNARMDAATKVAS